MRKEVREIVDYAESIGFKCGDLDGSGHYPLRHRNGLYSLPATASDWRNAQNARAALRRIAGVEHDGPNSGKYRRGVSRRRDRVPHLASDHEVVSSKIGRLLLDRHREKCDEINAARSAGVTGWRLRSINLELENIEAAMRDRGIKIPLRTIRREA